jgi:hypothetical protein
MADQNEFRPEKKVLTSGPTTSDQFVGSRLKVKRAERHIEEVKSLFGHFLKTDFCKVHIEVDPDTGNNLLKLDSIAKAPPEIALAVGDAIHNLRTAMDHVAFDILGTTADWISFPVGKKRDDVIATRQHRAIKAAIPDLADFIADTIKPYLGGDFALWEIGTLDNLDKHRLTLPVVSIQALTGVSAEDENGNRFTNNTLVVGEGGVLRAISTYAKMKITSYGNPAADILFGKGTAAEGKPVIPTLAEFAQLTLQAINALETFHFGKASDPAVKS